MGREKMKRVSRSEPGAAGASLCGGERRKWRKKEESRKPKSRGEERGEKRAD
jgi:hypothetical protein